MTFIKFYCWTSLAFILFLPTCPSIYLVLLILSKHMVIYFNTHLHFNDLSFKILYDIYMYMYIFTCTCIHAYIHVYMYMYMYIYKYTHVYVHVHVCIIHDCYIF